jgi:hypothetical protein
MLYRRERMLDEDLGRLVILEGRNLYRLQMEIGFPSSCLKLLQTAGEFPENERRQTDDSHPSTRCERRADLAEIALHLRGEEFTLTFGLVSHSLSRSASYEDNRSGFDAPVFDHKLRNLLG